MGRKSWVDRVAETGDWSGAEQKARSYLRKSNLETLYRARYPGRKSEGILVRELDGKPVKIAAITLARAYRAYQKRGGNRSLPDRILKELGKTRVEYLDRATLKEVAHKLYPRLSEAERAELVYDPIDEIVGLDRVAPKGGRPATPGRYDPYIYWLSRKAEIEAETERYEAMCQPLIAARAESDLDHLYRRADVLIDEQGNVWGSRGPDWPHHDPAPPVMLERGDLPPGAPATKRSGAKAGGAGVWRQTDYRTLYMQPLKRNKFGEYSAAGKPTDPGTRIRPGPPPSGNKNSERYDQDGNYLGWLSKAGRPRKPNKFSNAEKQRRYRERRKQR